MQDLPRLVSPVRHYRRTAESLTVVPCPTAVSMLSLPAYVAAKLCAIHGPSPVPLPPGLVVKNASAACWATVGGMLDESESAVMEGQFSMPFRRAPNSRNATVAGRSCAGLV